MNSTLLVDDIVGLDAQSTSTDIPFPSPADPFEGYVNITDHGIFDINNNSTGIRILEYLNLDSWHIYAICGVAIFIVILAIIALVVWLSMNKTRVINEGSDPVLTSNYQDDARCCSLLPCCSTKRRSSDQQQQRQNSSSNLEFYGRPPLPTSAYQARREHSQEEPYTIDTSNLAMYIDEIEEIPNRDIPPNMGRRALPSLDMQKYLYRQ